MCQLRLESEAKLQAPALPNVPQRSPTECSFLLNLCLSGNERIYFPPADANNAKARDGAKPRPRLVPAASDEILLEAGIVADGRTEMITFICFDGHTTTCPMF